MKKFLASVLVLLMVLTAVPFSSVTAFAEDASTEVEEAEVIEIKTVEDLYAINNNLSGNYILMNDIDLSEATKVGGDWDFMGNGWEPIGGGGIYTDANPFTGTFDGNGHVIRGMRMEIINTPSGTGTKYLGLFSKNQGTIKNLAVVDSIISEGYYVGAIAAYNEGLIENCYNDSYIEANDIYDRNISIYAGGISGYTEGNILNCYNLGKIKGVSCSMQTDDYAYRCDNYYSSNIGGIVGYSTSGAVVSNCFNSGLIDSKANDTSNAGGICGVSGGKVINCYNNAKITSKGAGYYYYHSSQQTLGNSYVGGISGQLYSSEIMNCYNVGTLLSEGKRSYSNYCIALIRSGTISDCYYLSGNGSSNTGAKALTEKQLQLEICMPGLDFENVWTLDTTLVYPYPQLKSLPQTTLRGAENITLVSEPTKTDYYIGDEIDCTGAYIAVDYLDGTSETIPVTADMLSECDMTTEGEKEVTVTYRNATCTFKINVEIKRNATGITLVSEPTQKEFIKGTAFDFSGCKIEVTYDNDTKATYDVTEGMITGADINSVGTQIVTVNFEGFTATFDVTVIPIKAERIAITTLPTKLNYNICEKLDTAGMVVTVYYNNGTSSVTNDYTATELSKELGKQTITVTFADFSATFEVSVGGHTEEIIPAVAPTCTQTGLTEGIKCSKCGEFIKAQETIGAFGHTVVTDNAVEATCTTAGKTEGSHCSVCNAVITAQETIPAKGHSYASVVTAPTCTEAGFTTYTCSACGDIYTADKVDALGHIVITDNAVEATCTTAGKTEGSHCSVCNTVITEQETIPAKGHIDGEWKVTKEPTYIETGVKTLYCAVCGVALRTETIEMLVNNSAVKSVDLGADNLEINYHNGHAFNPTVETTGDISYKVEYSSSNPNCVSVDENGNIYGNKKGSATITCTVTDANGVAVTDTCNVNVTFNFGQWLLYIICFGWIWM